MADPRVELSSIASTLEDLTRRVAAIAEGSSSDGNEDLAHDLFEVERSMVASHRTLQRALR